MTDLVFVDCETTGLDPDLHHAWEVCVWREHDPAPTTLQLPHTIDGHDPRALDLNGYWSRRQVNDWTAAERTAVIGRLVGLLNGTTLVAANPAFDARFLAKTIGRTPWHYRLIDIETYAMPILGLDRPCSLTGLATRLRLRGFDLPEPDHSAEADVRTLRACWDALRALTATTRETA